MKEKKACVEVWQIPGEQDASMPDGGM